MTISIIIPVFQVVDYVGQCMQSVVGQIDGCHAEIILVDDCSTDNSCELALSFLSNHHKFQVIRHHKNRGLSAARNSGLAVANGDYVLFVDSDDVLSEHCVSKLLSMAKAHPDADVVVGQFDEFENEGEYYPSKWKQQEGIYDGKIIEAYINNKIPVTAWNKLCKRSFLIDNHLFFEEGLVHEDALWSFQVACCARKVVVGDAVTYHYRQRVDSLDKQKNKVLHLEHYARVNALQSLFVFEKNLEYNYRIFLYIDQQRYQLMADTCRVDEALSRKLYKMFCYYPYWSLWQRSFKVFISFRIWLRSLHWSLPAPIGYILFKIICS